MLRQVADLPAVVCRDEVLATFLLTPATWPSATACMKRFCAILSEGGISISLGAPVTDTFTDGIRSIVSVLSPRLVGWREVPTDILPAGLKGPKRAFVHDASSLAVISAVEFIDDGKVDGPEYHLSISRQHRTLGTRRCSSTEARWVLVQFGMDGAHEDNHVPSGLVRNFWRPVADAMVGRECLCVERENAIREDKGDFIWRAA